MKKVIALGAVAATLALAACQPAADVASQNLSAAADNFEIARRITFYNGITDKIVLVTEGYCSLGNHDTGQRMSVTCKTKNGYIKNLLGLSDNVFFVSEQLNNVNVSEFHYRMVFRPQSLMPDVDFQGSTQELLHNQNNDG